MEVSAAGSPSIARRTQWRTGMSGSHDVKARPSAQGGTSGDSLTHDPSEKRSRAAATALWYVAPGRAELRTSPLSSPPDPAALATRADRLVAASAAAPSGSSPRRRAARASMRSDARAPAGGRVPVPGEIRLLRGRAWSRTGRRTSWAATVFVLHPHQDRFVAPAAMLAAAARRACRRAGPCWPPTWRRRSTRCGIPAPGRRPDRGRRRRRRRAARRLLCAARLPGAEVTLVDVEPGPRRARRGARRAVRAPAGRAGGRATSSFHASATADRASPPRSPRPGMEATVVEMSWYGDAAAAGAARRRLPQPPAAGCSSSPGRAGAAARRPRWSHAPPARGGARPPRATTALDALITGETAFADLPAALRRVSSAAGGTRLSPPPSATD